MDGKAALKSRNKVAGAEWPICAAASEEASSRRMLSFPDRPLINPVCRGWTRSAAAKAKTEFPMEAINLQSVLERFKGRVSAGWMPPEQSEILGMKIMYELLKSSGTSPPYQMCLNRLYKYGATNSDWPFQKEYGIPSGPGHESRVLPMMLMKVSKVGGSEIILSHVLE